MRSIRPLLPLSMLALATGCALLSRSYNPPHAPKAEAAQIKFPLGAPRERVVLAGVWLRAVTLALDDFLPEEAAERAKAEGGLSACVARRDSYLVEAFVWSPTGDAGTNDGSEPDGGPMLDAGSDSSADAGDDGAWTQPGMPKTPPVIYVSISLNPDACDFGDSPLLDAGATYAIDTVNWRVLAVRP